MTLRVRKFKHLRTGAVVSAVRIEGPESSMADVARWLEEDPNIASAVVETKFSSAPDSRFPAGSIYLRITTVTGSIHAGPESFWVVRDWPQSSPVWTTVGLYNLFDPLPGDVEVDTATFQAVTEMLDRGIDGRQWPQDEQDFFRNFDCDVTGFSGRALAMRQYRAKKIIALIRGEDRKQ